MGLLRVLIAPAGPRHVPPAWPVRALNFAAAFLLVVLIFYFAFSQLETRWGWNSVYRYRQKFVQGWLNTVWISLAALGLSTSIGLFFALAQRSRFLPLYYFSKIYVEVVRGTPLLVQLWLLYFGLGSLFPMIPGIRQSFLWPVLREGYFYALLAFTISVAGYEGEVMRGAFLGVPKGELEAAKAFGMSPLQVLRRIWFPRAVRLALPVLAGDTAIQLKATPLAATVTVLDLFGVSNKIRQDTYRVYEPLLLVLVAYVVLYFFIVWAFRWYENRIPQKR